MVFSRQYPATLKTSSQSIQPLPEFSIKNPLKKDIFCNGIEVVTSPEFTRFGVMVIKVNEITLFDSRSQDAFANIAKMSIPLNAILKRDSSVEIYIFNSGNENELTCTSTVFLDEASKVLDSSFSYLPDEAINTQVSEPEILFPVKRYTNETNYKFLDMKGYKKLIAIFQSNTNEDPELIDSSTYDKSYLTGTGSWPNQFKDSITNQPLDEISFDGFNSSKTYDTKTDDDKILTIVLKENNYETLFDNRARYVVFNTVFCINVFTHIEVFYNRVWKIEESSVSDFSSDVNLVAENLDTSELNSTATTKRFVRFLESVTVSFMNIGIPSPEGRNCSNVFCRTEIGCCNDNCAGMVSIMRQVPPIEFTQIFDRLRTNGTAALSFEILAPDSEDWNEFIGKDEFGTVTEGEKLIVQIGDTVVASSNRTFALPSTQSRFRAKLEVVEGIVTGVSVIKVI